MGTRVHVPIQMYHTYIHIKNSKEELCHSGIINMLGFRIFVEISNYVSINTLRDIK